MINPFGQQTCPKGGWRYHCGPNCLYKHYDDIDSHTTNSDIPKIADDIHGYHPGYKSKLRSTKTQVHHGKPSKQSAVFTVDNSNINQISQSFQNLSKNALRKKRHNLNGVYGGNKGDYLSTGLKNTGNYCYSIAVLQCIVKCEELFKMLMNGREGKLNHISGSLTDELRFLAMVLRSGEYRYVTPNDFRLKVADKLSQFSGNRQHDAHEFLTCLLDKVKEEMSTENLPIRYEGEYEMSVTCEVCGNITGPKYEAFNSLHVNIPEGVRPTLAKGIAKMLQGENLEQYLCEKCQIKVPAIKNTKLRVLPGVLILSVKRFSQDKFGLISKDTRTVNFSPFFDIEDSSGKKSTYELVSFINHVGQTSGGHYTACCKDVISNKWLFCNDSKVSEVDVKEIPQKDVYILFYEKTDVHEIIINSSADLFDVESISQNCSTYKDDVEHDIKETDEKEEEEAILETYLRNDRSTYENSQRETEVLNEITDVNEENGISSENGEIFSPTNSDIPKLSSKTNEVEEKAEGKVREIRKRNLSRKEREAMVQMKN